MKLTKKLIYICLILNSSCFRSVDSQKAELLPSLSLEKISQSAFTSNSFESDNVREEKWWEIFENQELDNLIEQALADSPTIQLAESKIVAAQAAAKSVRSKLFPNLSANAEDNWTYLSKYGFFRDFFPLPPNDVIPSKFNEIDLSLNFSYEIDFWGKNRKKLAQALGLAVSLQMEKKQTELILCETVAYAYFQWQAHTAEKLIYENWLESEEKLSKFFSSRHEIGVDNTIPPLKQNQQVGNIRIKILELEKKREIDLFFLKNLIGKGPDELLFLTYTPESLNKKISLPEHLGLNLLAQRPDLMAQIWKVAAAGEAIGVAKTEFYPDVNLKAIGGLSSLTFSHLFNWASRDGSLTPAIHLPLFTGGQLTANLSQKVALFNEEVHSYNEKLLSAAEEVAKEITTFLSIEKQMNIQKSVVLEQKKDFEISKLRHEKGLDDYRQTLISSQNLCSQEILLIELNHSHILSTLRIIQSLGGGMQPQKLPSSLYP